jgi:hypothetical protein
VLVLDVSMKYANIVSILHRHRSTPTSTIVRRRYSLHAVGEDARGKREAIVIDDDTIDSTRWVERR